MKACEMVKQKKKGGRCGLILKKFYCINNHKIDKKYRIPLKGD
jgi:hypothetical protein